MTWLLLPRIEVDLLSGDMGLCQAFSKFLDDDLLDHFSILIRHRQRYQGKAERFGNDCTLITLWSASTELPRDVTASEFICYWSSSSDSSMITLDAQDRGEVLHRTCQLAVRVWGKLPYLDFWHYSSHGDVESVYAAAVKRAQDLRITFLPKTVESRQILFIGAPYFARRTSTPVRTPDDALMKAIPRRLAPPPNSLFPPESTEHEEDSHDDGDLTIHTPPTKGSGLFGLSYDAWMSSAGPLTKQQRRVIERPLDRPLRIHGAAGSGKTLVLILKALRLIREAQATETQCHILFVVTSTAVQGAIRAAFEMIDDQASLATTPGDKQYLNLDTLHGWCIRELGAEIGGARVLERDPKVSKEIQIKLLNQVYQTVHEREFKRLKDYLSKDFITRIEGKREALIRDLQREIGIRIKGRGFRRSDRELYVKNGMSSFIGRRETEWDRHFIFHVYDLYEKQFHDERLLDTDDIALSMSLRLSSTMWDRQRLELGYDYVFVDETHLFNENERRLFPLLTRGVTEYPTIAMTFDEAQSIGGARGSLETLGITNSEKKTLSVVHRSSPDIFSLARDLVARSPLMFTEFGSSEAVPRMSESDLKRAKKPSVIRAVPSVGVPRTVATQVSLLRAGGYERVGVICFATQQYDFVLAALQQTVASAVYEVEERGEKLAAIPRPGIYVMTPESCGGLEFDAVVFSGVDQGSVPAPIGDLSREGYLSTLEEAFKELYTAITRARFVLQVVVDPARGLSELLTPAILTGLLEEHSK